MLREHCKLLAVLQETGEIVGRKKLQKLIYIMKKLNFPFYEKYEFHFFGPYSEELNLKVEEVCHLSFVEEDKEKKSGYFQYRYTLTEKGEEFLNMSSYQPPMTKELLVDLNGQNARFLELVSTIFYFERYSREEVEEKVFTLKAKQNYDKEDMDRAYKYISALKRMVS